MVVVVGATVVVVGANVEEVVVVVVVVVSGGITKPLAHPHRMSMGAPTLKSLVEGCASR